MILKFKDVAELSIQHYDHHMKKHGGKIHPITIMEEIFVCLANANANGEDKHFYNQIKAFVEDMGVNYE